MVLSFLLRYDIEIIPPETQRAENKDIYNPNLLFIWSGFVIKNIPRNPKIIEKNTEILIFSIKIIEEIMHVKKTFVNPIVLAWASDR